MTIRTWVIVVIIAAALGAGFTRGYLVGGQGDDKPGSGVGGVTVVVVPNLVGLSLAEARSVAEEIGLGMEVRVLRDGQTGSAGVVVDQDPLPGASVGRGSVVGLELSG